MTVEMVLILVVLIGATYQVQQHLFEDPGNNPFVHFVTNPWKSIKVMMESGVWTSDKDEGREQHPNQFERMRSEEGDNPAR